MRKGIHINNHVVLATCRLVEEGFEIDVLAEALKLPVRKLSRWLTSAKDGDLDWLKGPALESFEQQEISRLNGELARMTAERDVFKALLQSPRWIEKEVQITLTKQRPMRAPAVEI